MTFGVSTKSKNFGPVKKPLYEYIQTFDADFLNEFGMIAANPLRVRNVVAEHFLYGKDKVVHGLSDHWLSSEQDIVNFLIGKKDDCDGMAVFTASWLQSIGYKSVRLCLGYYKSAYHMWVCIAKDDAKLTEDNVLLVETAGDSILNDLPLLKNCSDYKIKWSASYTDKRTYKHNV